MIISQQNIHCFFHWKIVSEALSCILSFKNFLGEAPIPPYQEGAFAPLSYSPPLASSKLALMLFGMSNFPNLKGTGTFPIWWIKSLQLDSDKKETI